MNLGRLEQVKLRDVWKHEDSHFTPWLAKEENMELLGEAIELELEVKAQEERVGPFRADILCQETSSDRFVLIENQFGKTDHSHLGQLMTYASGLSAVTIIWISEKFTEEHRAALDWLNRITDDSVDFFGIEIELYRIGSSDPAPKFNVISKPNNWSRNIKRTAESTEITETKLMQQEYWQALKEFMESNKSFIKMQKPLPQHWTNIAIGRSHFHLSAFANTREKKIGVLLVISGPNFDMHFQTLFDRFHDDSLLNLFPDISWDKKEGGKEHHVALRIGESDPLNKTDWPRQQQLLKTALEKFHLYFRDKIKDV